jgi:pilus assembly protein Flp/PilA
MSVRKISAAFVLSEKGATAAEYAIMASLIAVVIILAVTGLGVKVVALFSSVTNAPW